MMYTTRKSGFALIATLSIMLLIVLLLVAMLSLSTSTTRSQENGRDLAEAQANAKLALKLAIGELQKQMGPDQRISARGLTLGRHQSVDVTLNTNSARAWWVGAASSDVNETIGSDNQPVVWLVSGLNPAASSKEQIAATSPFETREVIMFGVNSIDLTLTGGEPISAGIVPVFDREGKNTGSYAYFVDDNGMKAQLAASHTEVVNEDETNERPGGTVIPGSYDLSILDGMSVLTGTAVSDYSKLISFNNLALLGGGAQISKNKRMSYTTQSLGVLADVKKGGLKKDLTIAFENHEIDPDAAYHPEGGNYPNWPVYTVFENTLGKDYNASVRRSDNPAQDDDWGDYLVVDESKRSEFGANGYIHWAMFRDYYNMKRFIRRASNANKAANGAMDYLDPIVLHNTLFSFMGGTKSFGNGRLPPHEMGPYVGGSSFKMGSGRKEGIPYGNYRTWPNIGNRGDKEFLEYYKHSPILPIMSKLQMNVWLEQGQIPPEGDPSYDASIVDAVETNYQFYLSYYNPFNIGLRYWDPNQARSFSAGNMPLAVFYIPEAEIDFKPISNYTYTYKGWDSIQTESPSLQNRGYGTRTAPVYVGPGRALTLGITKDVEAARVVIEKAFDYNFIDNIDSNIHKNYPTRNPVPSTLDMEVHFSAVTNMMFGVAQQGSGGGYSASQVHWNAFAREPVRMGSYKNSPGININVPPAGLGFNTMASLAYKLRSTTEGDSNSVRPLLDANIRAFFLSPAWDSPLGLDTSAAYIIDNTLDVGDQVPQMLATTDGEGTEIGFTYWGSADYPPDGFDRVILFDIPRKDLVSLGQLQHANAGRFSYEPSYIVGNSYANPRIPQSEWKASISDTYASASRGFDPDNNAIPGTFDIYDASYLVNEGLWDSFIFTTIPQKADNYNDPDDPDPTEEHFAALLSRDAFLPNPRLIPYEPAGSRFDKETLQTVGDDNNISAFYYNAGHLLVDGAFNVNSTSVDAWEAFLSGTYGIPFLEMDETGAITGLEPVEERVRFPRVHSVFGEPFETGSPTPEGYWTGFRALTSDEIRELAVEIVDQIKERGPFLTLGEFINRKLETGEHGEKGALQAALDKTVNKNPSSLYSASANHSALPNGENQSAGFPGQLLQGDLLQALSPMMTVRSDTFTIRAYGDSIKSSDGKLLARAWCEAVVQRLPDPVSHDPGKKYLEELAKPSSPFGRNFRVISFRWLSEDEI